MAATPLLLTQDVSITFGGISALDGVDLAVKPAEIVGVLGPNGAGKSTLFNVISGFLKPNRGKIHLGERDMTGMLPYERVAAGLGRTFQQVRLFRNLTVMENLLVAQHRHLRAGAWSSMLRLPVWRRDEKVARKRVEAILDVVNLRPWADTYPSQLSYGTLRFLELASVLSLQPRILLLDEPASGIQQKEVEALGPMLKRVRDETGCAILLIEHDMNLLLSVSDYVYALDFGRVIAEDPPGKIVHEDRVLESYLGRTRRGEDPSAARKGAIAPA
jgi:branched-chain amino acid transport system ATP-binding protein